jgi:hypothetical protein
MSKPGFDDELRDRVAYAVRPGEVINTLGVARPNRIVSIDRDGILVETERSIDRKTGPQLVPAWLVTTAWEHLRLHGRLTNLQLLNDLNVKRSAFVCALLSHFDEVEIESLRPIALRLRTATRPSEEAEHE